MSTPVNNSLAGLKESTAQLVGIIARAQHIPAGTGQAHFALTAQVTTLLGHIIRAYEKGDYMPGIVASCLKELMRVHSMTPRVWPNWHSIGHDDPWVLKHAWRNKVRAWEALGDNSCDLHVLPNASTGPLTVDLPSPPILPSAPVLPSPPFIAGSSSQTTSKFQDKGKGKEVAADLEPEVEGSRKRKSPMISGNSSQPLKSAMKGRKCVKSTRPVKSKPIVESEDDEETIVQPISRGVPVVVLPQLSTIIARQPQSPCSLPQTRISRLEDIATSGSRPDVAEPDDESSVGGGHTGEGQLMRADGPRPSEKSRTGWNEQGTDYETCTSYMYLCASRSRQDPWHHWQIPRSQTPLTQVPPTKKRHSRVVAEDAGETEVTGRVNESVRVNTNGNGKQTKVGKYEGA
ncbi:hypothetical protein EV702DRAFT_1051269 [Suillus placidus]|uniref:Uncharacterized protein n=1 Tax=Suillus placidus TaxID=48579 RepID=A0A9P6ZH17_9AGAM|nr:hypothetical protein EV702DRAFT_1051269 [Suillus placidus]